MITSSELNKLLKNPAMPYKATQIAAARTALNRLTLYLNGTPINIALRRENVDNLTTPSLTINRIHEFADLP